MVKSENGEIKQVGRSCLKDYTGISPAAAFLWAEVRDVMPEVRDYTPDEWDRAGYAPMYDVKTVIALAVDAIAGYGYRKAEDPDTDSTKHLVAVAIAKEKEPSKEACKKAAEIVDWLKGLPEAERKAKAWNAERREKAIQKAMEQGWTEQEIEEGVKGIAVNIPGVDEVYCGEKDFSVCDFLPKADWPDNNPYNLKSVERNCIPLAVSGYARARHFGLLAYMPLAYDRYMERKAREAKRAAEKETEAAASEYVGKAKDRLTIQTATAALLTSWETGFGTTYLYKFTDAAGNVFIWKASAKVDGLTDNVTLKGTVKAHNERDGVKQTVLTRCKIIA